MNLDADIEVGERLHILPHAHRAHRAHFKPREVKLHVLHHQAEPAVLSGLHERLEPLRCARAADARHAADVGARQKPARRLGQPHVLGRRDGTLEVPISECGERTCIRRSLLKRTVMREVEPPARIHLPRRQSQGAPAELHVVLCVDLLESGESRAVAFSREDHGLFGLVGKEPVDQTLARPVEAEDEGGESPVAFDREHVVGHAARGRIRNEPAILLDGFGLHDPEGRERLARSRGAAVGLGVEPVHAQVLRHERKPEVHRHLRRGLVDEGLQLGRRPEVPHEEAWRHAQTPDAFTPERHFGQALHMEDHLEPSRAEGPFDLGHLDAHAGHGTARRLQVKEHLINHRLLPADIARVARSQQARKACAAEDNPLSPRHRHLHRIATREHPTSVG